MQFKQEARVLTSEGQDVGRVDRVVLNPSSKEVTHIVVRKGLLFTEDKVVPLSLIASTTEDDVMLRPDAGDLEALPPFEETHYIPLNEREERAIAYPSGFAAPFYWYPPMTGWYAYPPPYLAETEQNIPYDTVALKEGARVITADGDHFGHIERVFTDSMADRATYFLVSRGILMRERKLIPVSWVRNVLEDEVHLSVGTSILDELREYQET